MAALLKILAFVAVLVLVMVHDSTQQYTYYRGQRMYDPYWCYGRFRPQQVTVQQSPVTYYPRPISYNYGYGYGGCIPRYNYGSYGYGSGGGGYSYPFQAQPMPMPYSQAGQQQGFGVQAAAAQGQGDNQPEVYDSNLVRGQVALLQAEPQAGQNMVQGAEASQQGQNTILPYGVQSPRQVGGEGTYYTAPIPSSGGGFSTLPYYGQGQDQAGGSYSPFGDASGQQQMQIQPYPYSYAQPAQSQYTQPQYAQPQYAQPQYAQPQYAQGQYGQGQYGQDQYPASYQPQQNQG